MLEIIYTPRVTLRDNLAKKNIPSLDGLRGISALSVAFAHASGLPRWIPADYAVVLFFEISGLLITWLLVTASVVTSKAANDGHFKTGQWKQPEQR